MDVGKYLSNKVYDGIKVIRSAVAYEELDRAHLYMDLQRKQRDRLMDILGRHVVPEDKGKSDRDFVRAVFGRFEKHMGAHHGDPNE